MYDVARNRITVIDFGKSVTSPVDDREFGLIDVKGLARLFTSIICIPPIPFYTEMVNNASSVHELLALLSSLPLLRIPKRHSIDHRYLSIHAEQRYIRMSEWIHVFRQHFDIRARMTFQYDSTAQVLIQIRFDQSSQRVMIICGAKYDLKNEFAAFCREIIRIFMRDWTFVQRSRLSKEHPRPEYGDLKKGDRSRDIEAGRGLSLEQSVEGLASAFASWEAEQQKNDVVTRLSTMAEADANRLFACFYCGEFSVHGRVNVGNILCLCDYHGVFDEGQWNTMSEIIMQQALQKPRGRNMLRLRLRVLFEDFVNDLRKSNYDGRLPLTMNSQWNALR
jgi:hypothetical protein